MIFIGEITFNNQVIFVYKVKMYREHLLSFEMLCELNCCI